MKSFLNNLSLGVKIGFSVAIFLVPFGLLAVFFVNEKEQLIDFTNAEIAGVHYLKPTHVAVNALASPNATKSDFAKSVEAIKAAEKEDAGATKVTDKSKALIAALQDLAEGKDNPDAMTKATDLISATSDNSNITLDPDTDAYFVGDILVNQATGILVQACNLLSAAKALDVDKNNDDNKIAFAEARDGIISSAGNVTTELAKAIAGNTDGSVKTALEADGKKIADAVDAVTAITKTADRKGLVAATANLVSVTSAFVAKDADVMQHLLDARNDGFHSVIVNRLTTAFAAVLVGGLIAWIVIRSVTKPLGEVTRLMGQITDGDLSIALPKADRKDEVGGLILALRSFHEAAVERDRARRAEEKRNDAERMRANQMRELNEAFKGSINGALQGLRNSVSVLNTTSTNMARDSQDASHQATTVAAAAEQASANVQTVASASEELTASIQEIMRRIGDSRHVSERASEEAAKTRQSVLALSEATGKIGDVVSLINQIAGQTNLLALNATIEAARAGEAGKGFAVVASEVKTLANQTAKATEDITAHIEGIQGSVKNVTSAIEGIAETVAQVNDISIAIANSVEQQDQATKEIARNIQEAAQGAAEVTTNITHIAQTIARAGATSGEMLSVAKGLDSQSGTLEEDVGSYLANIEAC